MGLSVDAPAIRARQFTVLGESQSLQGDYAAAIVAFEQALKLARDPARGDRELLPRILVGRGQAKASLDDFAGAEKDVREALKIDRAMPGAFSADVARDLEALGLVKNFGGDLPAARALYEEALAIRIAQQGADHPRVSEDYSELGSIAYLQNDPTGAESFWLKALRTDEKVLGLDHPDVATTLNNLARVKLERRAFGEARPLLQRAVQITLTQRNETHDDLAFSMDNLAIADRGLGHLHDAEMEFRKALAAARLHKHRNRGPIMTDLAELLCSEGRFAEAYDLMAQAEPLMIADYPHDPWRVAWLQSTKGYCLTKGRRPAASGMRLIKESAPAIQARWKPDTLYGAVVADRLRKDAKSPGVRRVSVDEPLPQ
jgi:tetratricopeptide (TPR) repeat protein